MWTLNWYLGDDWWCFTSTDKGPVPNGTLHVHLRSYGATGQRLCWTQRPRRRPDLQDRKSEGPSLAVAGPTPKLPRLYLQDPRSVPCAEGNVFFEVTGPVQAPKLLTAAIADIIKHKQTFSKREHISSSTQYKWPVPTWRQTARSNPTPSQARRDLRPILDLRTLNRALVRWPFRMQGSRVRPNFPMVRLTKIWGCTGASRRQKKSPRLRKSPCGSTTDTH